MHKKILILVSVIVVFGFGTATALIVPVGFTTNDNVQLYTKSKTFMCEPNPSNPNDQINECPFSGSDTLLFCDEGDTIINGYLNIKPFSNLGFNQPTEVGIARNVDGKDGWNISFSFESRLISFWIVWTFL